jgi:hypothetical protein
MSGPRLSVEEDRKPQEELASGEIAGVGPPSGGFGLAITGGELPRGPLGLGSSVRSCSCSLACATIPAELIPHSIFFSSLNCSLYLLFRSICSALFAF